MAQYKKIGNDRFIKLSDAWLIFGGGPRPVDPDNPTPREKARGAAFYRRLVDKGVLRGIRVNGERFVNEADVQRLWSQGGEAVEAQTKTRRSSRKSARDLGRRFRERRQREREGL